MRTSKESAQTPEPQLWSFQFPDCDALRANLNAALANNGHARGPVSIVARETVSCSTYPSEIVTCRMVDGTELKLYCKYSVGQKLEGDTHRDNVLHEVYQHVFQSHGHRGGVPYEADVYRHVLQPIGFSTPVFYGAYDEPGGNTWLFLEYLDEGLRMNKGPQPQTYLRAAEWLGRFHAINATRFSSGTLSFLSRYDAEYYLGWVGRTSEYAGDVHRRYPWLRTLCKRAEEFVVPLLSAPLTVIHGEFYGKNVVYRQGMIHPVDWESAAVAAGEIDLASMTEGWDEDITQMCKVEYQRARWSDLATADFERIFAAARLYLNFRWMGDRPEWTTDHENSYYFEDMRSLGEQLGLL